MNDPLDKITGLLTNVAFTLWIIAVCLIIQTCRGC